MRQLPQPHAAIGGELVCLLPGRGHHLQSLPPADAPRHRARAHDGRRGFWETHAAGADVSHLGLRAGLQVCHAADDLDF